MEHKKLVYGGYEISDGRHIMATSPMTDAELAAWKRYPDTFFGEVRHVGGKAENWLELCEFFYGSYKDTPRGGSRYRLLRAVGVDGVSSKPESFMTQSARDFCPWRIASMTAPGATRTQFALTPIRFPKRRGAGLYMRD